MKKITKAQRNALEIAVERGSRGISTSDAKSTTISALQMDNLITAYHIPGGGVRYRISDAGRQALALNKQS